MLDTAPEGRLMEPFFSIPARRLLNRGVFTSPEAMVTKVMAFIAEYNRTARPFRWTTTGAPCGRPDMWPSLTRGCTSVLSH